MRVGRSGAVLVSIGLVAALAGCELEDVSVTSVEAVVVAEVFVDLASDPTDNSARAFLHWTVGLDAPDVEALEGAVVSIRRDDGFAFALTAATVEACVESVAEAEAGACYVDAGGAASLAPGDRIEVSVEISGGGALFGATTIPGDFELEGFPVACRVPPNTLLPIEWSRSESAWAYVDETLIIGLPGALAAEGISGVDDPLYLLGLSISDDDNTIVFPSEFGVFDRFDLDQELAVRLQQGLPDGSWAQVRITATDRNYVNWARGGNFNPSGQVRVPSLSGDGTGVLGATVGRRLTIVATTDPDHPFPPCP